MQRYNWQCRWQNISPSLDSQSSLMCLGNYSWQAAEHSADKSTT